MRWQRIGFSENVFKELGDEFTDQASGARHVLELRGLAGVHRLLGKLYTHHGPRGTLARTSPTGSMMLWVAVLLGVS